jgi:hypothetical protein
VDAERRCRSIVGCVPRALKSVRRIQSASEEWGVGRGFSGYGGMRSTTRFLASNDNATIQVKLIEQKNKVMNKAVGEDTWRTGVVR